MRYDTLTPKERSERMSRIRNADTKPEITIRRLVHGMGYRYRLHAKDLPGHPDMVFRRKKKVIFVHGCFWHQHGCNHYRMPKSRLEFWLPKLKKNAERDLTAQESLLEQGWDTLVIWECQIKIKNEEFLRRRIEEFLEEKQ